MAVKMLSRQMIKEYLVIKEVLFAEIAPRMRQYFCLAIIACISKFNMCFQLLHVIDTLLPNKHQTTLQTNLAESLLVVHLQMTLERLNVVETVTRVALAY